MRNRLRLLVAILILATSLFPLEEKPLIDEEKVIDTFREMSDQDTWFSKLLRSVFVFERESRKLDRQLSTDPVDTFISYQGRTICNIRIVILDVFGTSVHDPKRRSDNWLDRTGNALHVKTHSRMIRGQLLFRSGDRLDPILIAESERILRKNRYIYDARIKPLPNPDGTVDLDIYVRDIWTLKAEVAMKNIEKWDVSITDDNLAGWGGKFHAKLKLDPGYKDGWNWDMSYRQQNLFKDNITVQGYRKVRLGSRQKGFGVNREFDSPLIRWLYGANFEWNRNEVSFLHDDMNTEEIRFNRQDVWLGRSFPLSLASNESGTVSYLTSATRFVRTDQTLRPDNDPDGFIQDSRMGLFSLGYLIRSYRKVSYLYRFGVTEDIPVGSRLEAIAGYEDGTYYNRAYYALNYIYSYYHQDWGYFSGNAFASGFRRADDWESRRLQCSLTGISRLIYYRNYRIRQYAMLQYNRIDRPIYTGQMLTISDQNGIRGMESSKTGDKKLRLNLETNYLLPFRFLGFHFAMSVFGDFALLSPKNERLATSRLYQGYGIGLRFKNEHLIFKTIEVFLGYYPVMDDTEDWNLFSRSASYYNFSSMGFGKPEAYE